MKKAFYALLLALALPVFAQTNSCGNPVTTPQVGFDDISGGVGYTCLPTPIGPGTAPWIRSNSAGMMVWWYCPSTTTPTKYSPSFFVVTSDALNTNSFFGLAQAIIKAPDPKAAANAAITTQAAASASSTSTLPLNDPKILAVTCQFQKEMFAGLVAVNGFTSGGTGPKYVVTKSVTGNTRNAFTPSGGVLGSPTGIATVGAACNCTTPVKIGLTSYCTFDGSTGPSQVTICTKVTP